MFGIRFLALRVVYSSAADWGSDLNSGTRRSFGTGAIVLFTVVRCVPLLCRVVYQRPIGLCPIQIREPTGLTQGNYVTVFGGETRRIDQDRNARNVMDRYVLWLLLFEVHGSIADPSTLGDRLSDVDVVKSPFCPSRFGGVTLFSRAFHFGTHLNSTMCEIFYEFSMVV